MYALLLEDSACLVQLDVSFEFYFVPVSLQVEVAFNIVYNGGLNAYALYLDCEGGRATHRGYEKSMTHLFKNIRKHLHTLKVSVSLCEQVLLTHTHVH